MKKGGIKLKEHLDKNKFEAFKYFYENSTYEILAYKSSGGILLKLTLNSGVDSPYTITRSNIINADVTEILLKIVFINDNNKEFTLTVNDGKYSYSQSKTYTYNQTSESEFLSEVETQKEIFKKSLTETLEPICPGIAFSNIYDGINDFFSNNMIPHILNVKDNDKRSNTYQIFKQIREYIENTSRYKTMQNNPNEDEYILSRNPKINEHIIFKYGLIAMEFLSGFQTLEEYIDNASDISMQKNAESMARFEIATLYHLGYIHGDLHTENILIDPTYKYFDGIDGRVILIDFGSTFKLEPCKLLNIETDPEQDPKEGYYALNAQNLYQPCYHSFIIDSPGYTQGTAFNHEYYQWLKVTDFEEENKKLEDLLNKRLSYIEKFNQHISNPNSRSGGGETHIHSSTSKNIFDTLDPANMLTRANIQNYIISETDRKSTGGSKSKSKKGRNYKTKKNKFLRN